MMRSYSSLGRSQEALKLLDLAKEAEYEFGSREYNWLVQCLANCRSCCILIPPSREAQCFSHMLIILIHRANIVGAFLLGENGIARDADKREDLGNVDVHA